MEDLKQWLHEIVKNKITSENITSIVKSEFYIKTFKACFNS